MATVRLDKYIASTLVISRKDAAALLKRGHITVDGAVVTGGDTKVEPCAVQVCCDGKPLVYEAFLYLMLNKPRGLVCAHEDKRDGTVMSLFPAEYLAKGIACVGRLDKDTVGLLLVTNDGSLAHTLLSPKSHAKKTYLVTADKPFVPQDAETMRRGIVIEGKNTAPAYLEPGENPFTARVTLTEGKFHEVKRLCYACGEKNVLRLERTDFAGLHLDPSLAEGQWRALTAAEVALLKNVKNG